MAEEEFRYIEIYNKALVCREKAEEMGLNEKEKKFLELVLKQIEEMRAQGLYPSPVCE